MPEWPGRKQRGARASLVMVRRNNTGTDQLPRVKLMYCFLTMQTVHYSCSV